MIIFLIAYLKVLDKSSIADDLVSLLVRISLLKRNLRKLRFTP